jgi:hypothetical protein
MALAVSGCGRVAFDGRSPSDGAPGADTLAAPSCWSSWQGGPVLSDPVELTELSTSSLEKNPFLSDDRLTLYFASDRTGGLGGLDFWRAHRVTVDDPFVVDGPVVDLNSPFNEGRVHLDSTELVAVLSTLRAGSEGANDLWIATRPDLASSFVLDHAAMASLNSSSDEKDPDLVRDGERLYYTVGDVQIRVSDRSGGTYLASQPVATPSLAGTTSIADPQVSPDELVIVFSGILGGSSDVFMATRASVGDAFANAQPLTVLNTSLTEHDLFVTTDGCEIWFARGSTERNLWMSRVIQ